MTRAAPALWLLTTRTPYAGLCSSSCLRLKLALGKKIQHPCHASTTCLSTHAARRVWNLPESPLAEIRPRYGRDMSEIWARFGCTRRRSRSAKEIEPGWVTLTCVHHVYLTRSPANIGNWVRLNAACGCRVVRSAGPTQLVRPGEGSTRVPLLRHTRMDGRCVLSHVWSRGAMLTHGCELAPLGGQARCSQLTLTYLGASYRYPLSV